MFSISAIEDYFLMLQKKLIETFEAYEPKMRFQSDYWKRPPNSQGIHGSGISAVLSDGAVFEKAGINFSHVYGEKLPASATRKRPELANRAFEALGVSVVIHAENPFVPTAHMNVRFFTTHTPHESSVAWFGGGFDLTPSYGFIEDCQHWHRTAQAACAVVDAAWYPRYKKWADEYFYLPHRQEPRGIGGIFFDDLSTPDLETGFTFVRSVGDHFSQAYLPIVERRKHLPYGNQEKIFQEYRRGRYVEFNLLYDRGTLFGLQSGGRTESILMSLPPTVRWRYTLQLEQQETQLLQDFLRARDWVT